MVTGARTAGLGDHRRVALYLESVTAVWHSAREGFFMFWETLWALVLGFGLSGAVQAFVSREEMQRLLGDHRPVTVARSSGFGMISSSCSWGGSSLRRSSSAGRS